MPVEALLLACAVLLLRVALWLGRRSETPRGAAPGRLTAGESPSAGGEATDLRGEP